MTCRELIDFLDDYLADELPRSVRDEFEKHLSECQPCRDYLRTYRDTVALVKGACTEPDNPEPPDAPPEPVQAILAAITARSQ